jgi:enoyl-CoA hydratase
MQNLLGNKMTTEIIFEQISGVDGDIGLITLNRQHALNALNHSMFIALHEHLIKWQIDAAIKAVVVRAVPGRAFSAGGDIRSVYERKSKNDEQLHSFFPDEYKVNKLIFHYSKPYIALLDGITMGGGVGISIHGSHRVATDRLVFAMPETTIGFYPDIGASYFLSRVPHNIGLYLGLTGEKITYADCYALGFVDLVVDYNRLDEIIKNLVEVALPTETDITNTINNFSIPVPQSALLEHQHEIECCFSYSTIEEIIQSLENYGSAWCMKTADILKTKSPTSLKVTLQQLRRGKDLDFDACMKMEARITQRMIEQHDFFEGIRSIIIDKDQKPRWQPQKFEEVQPQEVAQYFD